MILQIWTLLIGIAVVVSANGFLTTVVGVRGSEAGFSAGATGLVMSAYFAGFLFGTYLGPALVRRVGHIRAFSAMAALASVAGLLHVVSTDPLVWGGLRLVGGFCMVVLFMVVESWLNVLATNETRGRLFFTYNQVSLLCLGLTQLLLMLHADDGHLPFMLVSGLLTLALLPIALTNVRQPRRIRKVQLNLKELWETSPLGVAGTAIAALCTATILSLGPVYAQQTGLTTSQISIFMATVILGGGVLQVPIGRLSDLIDRRKVLLAVGLAGAVLSLALLAVSRFGPLMLAAIFMLGGAAFSLYPLAVAHTNDHVSTDKMLAISSGLLLVYAIGAIAAPIVVGFVMQAVGPQGIYLTLAAGMLLLTGFGIMRAMANPSVEADDQDAFVPMMRTSQAELEMLPDAAVEETVPAPAGAPDRKGAG